MIKPLVVLLLGMVMSTSAHPDSTESPTSFRFSPGIRVVAVESSTYLFLYGANGATVDVDLFGLPFATVHSVGVRANYQEYRRGFFLDHHRTQPPHAYLTSTFLRASYGKANTTTEVLLGMSSGDPRELIAKNQLAFGIELRSVVLRPVGSVFFRILGGPNGAAMQFGLAVGYFG
ncbi:MAG: hypothetical protein MUE68_05045 [Bacteroidetes bacterium]|jgi:hypothetical protein|nr:hypothetical protein [Bacteroidota bacterium]